MLCHSYLVREYGATTLHNTKTTFESTIEINF